MESQREGSDAWDETWRGSHLLLTIYHTLLKVTPFHPLPVLLITDLNVENDLTTLSFMVYK